MHAKTSRVVCDSGCCNTFSQSPRSCRCWPCRVWDASSANFSIMEHQYGHCYSPAPHCLLPLSARHGRAGTRGTIGRQDERLSIISIAQPGRDERRHCSGLRRIKSSEALKLNRARAGQWYHQLPLSHTRSITNMGFQMSSTCVFEAPHARHRWGRAAKIPRCWIMRRAV
jgi:hypothetical protein